MDPDTYWADKAYAARENRGGGFNFRSYHGRSWIPILGQATPEGWDAIYASHTFHEIQMYYPMRVYRDREYKLIWNIASGLPYPFASDLWAASSWQVQYRQGMDAPYGRKTVGEYIHRPPFELYAIAKDPEEATNLAGDPRVRRSPAGLSGQAQTTAAGTARSLDQQVALRMTPPPLNH